MNELYQGKLDKTCINKAIEELDTIQTELQRFEPNQVIWDIDDLSKQPPWGNNISKEITNLSNYFVTSEGADFISVFFRALRKANEVNAEIEIKSI